MGEGTVNGLEEVEPGGGGGLGELGVRGEEGGRRLVQEGVGRVVDGEVQAGVWRVCGVGAEGDVVKDLECREGPEKRGAHC